VEAFMRILDEKAQRLAASYPAQTPPSR